MDFLFSDGSLWRPHSDWSVNDTGWYTDESGEQAGTVDGYRIEQISPEQSQIRDRTPGPNWLRPTVMVTVITVGESIGKPGKDPKTRERSENH